MAVVLDEGFDYYASAGGYLVPTVFFQQMMGLFPIPDPGGEEREHTFGVDPLIGWRVWRIGTYQRLDGTIEPRLGPVSSALSWPPRERVTALCTKSGPAAHEAPHPTCACGLWALRTREEAERIAQNTNFQPAVFGGVAMWGRVLEFERGYRAQHAYPQSLYGYSGDLERIVHDVGELYGIETQIVARPPDHDDDMFKVMLGFGSSTAQLRAALQAMARTGLTATRGMDALAKAAKIVPNPVLSHTTEKLISLALAGGLTMDFYPHAQEAAYVAEHVDAYLVKISGSRFRRASRFRFIFATGGSYEIAAARDEEELQRHLMGRTPDIVVLPLSTDARFVSYLRARGIGVRARE